MFFISKRDTFLSMSCILSNTLNTMIHDALASIILLLFCYEILSFHKIKLSDISLKDKTKSYKGSPETQLKFAWEVSERFTKIRALFYKFFYFLKVLNIHSYKKTKGCLLKDKFPSLFLSPGH